MTPRVVVVRSAAGDRRHWSADAERVLAHFAERVDVYLDAIMTDTEREATVDAALADADALLLCGWGNVGIGYLSAERLARMPRLSYIGATTHFRHAEFVDMAYALERGIAFSETAPVMSPWVAEYELLLTLAALRNLPQEHAMVGGGGWVDFADITPGLDTLRGRRVGLASFGEIHRSFARLLAPFDTDWEAYDPYVPAAVIEAAGGRKADDIVAMAQRSEVFCVATPPTPATVGFIGASIINALPHDAVFVLVSRMSVVAQEPLIARLRAGEIRAAIDVYEPEPPAPDHSLRTLPNVVHTPHRAGNTYGAHNGVFTAQCQEARRHFAGEALRYPLRPELVALFPARHVGYTQSGMAQFGDTARKPSPT